MLTSLDLFSGVGGITLALHGVAAPVAYCEIDGHCRDVLAARQAAGQLPLAPVCHDVRSLNADWLRDNNVAAPDCIVGGFPCIGFSIIGSHAGFDNAQSGLFREIVRLVDALHPSMVFMENVPTIVRMGLHHIIDTFAARGYDLRWCTLSAAAVGAPHERRRWFGLAVRRGQEAVLARVPTTVANLPDEWNSVSPARLVSDKVPRRTERIGMMGNGVVPHCVRAAFMHLAGMHATVGPSAVPSVDLPRHGFTAGGTSAYSALPPAVPALAPRPGLVFDPTAFRCDKAPSVKLRTRRLTEPVNARQWSTPRHCNTGASNYLTARSVADLPTQVRFERGTLDAERTGQLNPAFVEWMMGYPAGWTAAAQPAPVQPI
jgi:hypothetical protein